MQCFFCAYWSHPSKIDGMVFLPHGNPLYFFNWNVIALQCGVSFCCTMTRTSYVCRYIPCLLSLPPTPPLPACPSRHHRALSWAPWVLQHLLISCFTHGGVFTSTLLSQLVPPSPCSTGPRVCPPHLLFLFLPCKQVHLDHFSRFHIYTPIDNICFPLSELLQFV